MQKIQTYLSQKEKKLFYFLGISKIYIKLWVFSSKYDPHTLCISEITDPEKRG